MEVEGERFKGKIVVGIAKTGLEPVTFISVGSVVIMTK